MNESTAFLLARWRRTGTVTLGFACLYVVAIVFFYSDWLTELPEADALVYLALLNGALCLGGGLTWVVARKGRVRRRAMTVAGTLCYAVALACLAAALASRAPALSYAAAIPAGLGAGVLIPLWFDRASRLTGERYAYALGFASLLSAPVVLVLDFVDSRALVAACGAFVLVSAALLLKREEGGEGGQDAPAPQDGDGSGPRRVGAQPEAALADYETARPCAKLAAPLAYVFLLSLVYGVLDVVAMANPASSADVPGFASVAAGIVADVGFLLYVRFDGRRYTTMLNAVLAVVATGLLFLPFLSGLYSVVLVVLTHMGWEIALLISYTLAIKLFRGNRDRLLGVAALVFAFPRPGVVLGSVAASFVAVDSRFAFAQMTIVSFALLYLIMMGIWLLRTREKRAAEHAIRKRDDLIKRYVRARNDLQDLACDELANKHGLTKRETEILKLLASGRDAAYIEKTLFLSRNTVKSYTKTLYAKLGVHSKQDVIDLVKDSLPLEPL